MMYMKHKKIFFAGAGAVIFGIIFGWVIFPAILNRILKSQVILKPGSQMRGMWEKTPFPLDFLIYVFNITNPEEVTRGGIPVLQEIGPYYFEQWKDKYDLEDNEEDDTVSFNMRNTYIFRPDKSNGLTGEEWIAFPHVLFQSIAIVVKRERAPMINLVNNAYNYIFPNATAISRGKFMDIFFRGIFIDCSSHEQFSAKALCAAFHSGEIKNSFPYNETHFVFSLFAGVNATDLGRFTVYRGVKDVSKLGTVIRYENEEAMDIWREGECNEFKGTDSTIFPPGMDKEDGIWSFTPDVCRSLGAVYRRKSSYAGLPALRYHLDLGDIKSDEKLHCFCDDPPNECPLKGTMNLMPCKGGPLIASMPHFFNGDESLFKNVIGMKPTEEQHAIFVDFEIISGTPLAAAKRLQFNLDVEPIPEINGMENLRKMVMPLFWIEEGLQLNKTYVNMLKYSLFLGLKFNSIFRWICIVGGFVVAAIVGYLHYRDSQKNMIKVTQTTVGNGNGTSTPTPNDKEPPVEMKENNEKPDRF